MWQRIQTLYLALATILIASMFFCNFATIIGPNGSEETIKYIEYGKFKPFLLYLIMLLTANMTALGSFKFRMLQMRVSVLSSILIAGFQIWIAAVAISNWNAMVFSMTAVFPVVAIILNVLAIRGILVDEAMVHAASHLRDPRKKKK